MTFGPILTTFGHFIGWVPEKAKNINMNVIIKISLLDFQADFFSKLQKESNSITYVKIRKKEYRNEVHNFKVWSILGS